MGLQPNTVSIIQQNGQELEISISQVKYGDKILVKPGNKIPVDGRSFPVLHLLMKVPLR